MQIMKYGTENETTFEDFYTRIRVRNNPHMAHPNQLGLGMKNWSK